MTRHFRTSDSFVGFLTQPTPCPETDRTVWGAYLYHPNRNITPPRIKKVFELLAESVQEVMG